MSRAVVQAFFDRLGCLGDTDGWLQLLAEDVVADTPYAPPGDPARYEGIDAVRRRFAEVRKAFDHLEFFDIEILGTDDPHRYVATCKSEGRRHDGQIYSNTYVWFFRVVEDRVQWWAEYFDPQHLGGR